MQADPDDVSWSEIGHRLKAIFTVIGLLLIGEIGYRWLTDPSDSLAIVQVAIAWIWTALHSLIFGADTVSLVTSPTGLPTVLEFSHANLAGSDMYPLEVTDECVGIHEIVFVAILIWLTPSISTKEKTRGILVMAAILAAINMARLLLLYPLAVRGCAQDAGSYGCWAPMWEFHQFMLDWGFLLIIMLGWTGWFLAVGGPKRVGVSDREIIKIPTSFSTRQPLTPTSLAVVAISVILALSATYTLAFDADAKKEKLEAEGCEDIISAQCAEEVREWENIYGKSIRAGIIAVLAGFLALAKPEYTDESTEEE